MCGNHFLKCNRQKDVIFLFLNFNYEAFYLSKKWQEIIAQITCTPTMEQILTSCYICFGILHCSNCVAFSARRDGGSVSYLFFLPGTEDLPLGTSEVAVCALRNIQIHARGVCFIPDDCVLKHRPLFIQTVRQWSPIGTYRIVPYRYIQNDPTSPACCEVCAGDRPTGSCLDVFNLLSSCAVPQ